MPGYYQSGTVYIDSDPAGKSQTIRNKEWEGYLYLLVTGCNHQYGFTAHGGNMIQFWQTGSVVMLVILALGGTNSCIADNIYDFTFNQHLWSTDISTNSDEDIEYDVAMPDGADFNLYIWDTWGEQWYSSKADGNTDWVIVPQHKGYKHYLYLYAYKGEGKWILSCDKIKWIGGSIRDLGEYTPDEVINLLKSNPDDEEYDDWDS